MWTNPDTGQQMPYNDMRWHVFRNTGPENMINMVRQNVYEYILGKMAAVGTNGQFRTPRHIIRMIVEMMEPNPKDIICDPAMGGAGFLVEACEIDSRERIIFKKG